MYALAEILGCTIGELQRRLTFSEFVEWMRYFEMKSEKQSGSEAVQIDDPEELARRML